MKVRLFTIPNLLTLANLVCGSVGVVMALSGGRLTTAFCLMILAAVFDFFDGFVARLLGQSSPIGLQLDSLSDDISFGLLPASILYVLYGRMPSLWLGEGPAAEAAAYVVFVVAAFAALRLAKFNIDDTQRTEFCGLPSPAAALLCGSLGLLAEDVRAQVPRLRLAGQRAALFVSGGRCGDDRAVARLCRAARYRALRRRLLRARPRVTYKPMRAGTWVVCRIA